MIKQLAVLIVCSIAGLLLLSACVADNSHTDKNKARAVLFNCEKFRTSMWTTRIINQPPYRKYEVEIINIKGYDESKYDSLEAKSKEIVAYMYEEFKKGKPNEINVTFIFEKEGMFTSDPKVKFTQKVKAI